MEPLKAVTALAALGETNRLAIFRRLVEAGPEGMVVGRIAEELAIAPATLSFHLKALAHAGLVRSSKESRFVRYVADFAAMNALVGYLTDHCCGGHPERCLTPADDAQTDTPSKEDHRAA